MTNPRYWAIAIGWIVAMQGAPAGACKYSVRDVGFVDLDAHPYRVYFYVGEDTPEQVQADIKRVSFVALMDGNLKSEIVNIDTQKNHDAIEYFEFWDFKQTPAGVLVSPDGHSLPLRLTGTDERFKERLWSVVEGLVSSPTREDIFRDIISAYCIVLLVEGPDEARNESARAAAEGAIEEMTGLMNQLPKPIDVPPKLVTVAPEMRMREKILLWAYDIDYADPDEAHVVVLYARGRQIGPMLNGEEITRKEVFKIISTIGQSCECGLDRKWMQGRMMPLTWSEDFQMKVADELGFDAEDPLIKSEISRILAKGKTTMSWADDSFDAMQASFFNDPSPPPTARDDVASKVTAPAHPVSRPASGQGEGAEVAMLAPSAIQAMDSAARSDPQPLAESNDDESKDQPAVPASTDETTGQTPRMAYAIPLIAFGGLGLLSIAGGLVVLLRGRHENKCE